MSSSESANMESFYQDHHNWLYALFNRKLSNHADAADLAQDAFLRLLRKPKCFDTPSGARAYLSHMAKGMCSDLWRKAQVEQAFRDAIHARSESFVISQEHHLIIVQTLLQVDNMLTKLPTKVSRAFWLSQLEGKRYKDIAVELDVSERMVKKYMAQAMLRLIIFAAEQPAQ